MNAAFAVNFAETQRIKNPRAFGEDVIVSVE